MNKTFLIDFQKGDDCVRERPPFRKFLSVQILGFCSDFDVYICTSEFCL